MASCGLPAVVRAGAIFRRDSAHIRRCTAASAATRKNAHTELDHIFKTILPAHGMTERPEQIRLSHTMLDAMFENRIALSDAGTGIGKTYAYLTAAIVYSHSRLVDGLPFQPVIIATSSIALQNAIVREYSLHRRG